MSHHYFIFASLWYSQKCSALPRQQEDEREHKLQFLVPFTCANILKLFASLVPNVRRCPAAYLCPALGLFQVPGVSPYSHTTPHRCAHK